MDEVVNQPDAIIEPKAKTKLRIKQLKRNKLVKHYKILDNLIAAANINDIALSVARDKVEAGRNGNKAFRAMASQLGKEQLIKLRSDLKMINFV